MHNDAFYAAVAVALPVLLLAYIAEARARIAEHVLRITAVSAEARARLIELQSRATAVETESDIDQLLAPIRSLEATLDNRSDVERWAGRAAVTQLAALYVLLAAAAGLVAALAALLFGSAGWQGWLYAAVCVVCTLVTLAGTCWMLWQTVEEASRFRPAQLEPHGDDDRLTNVMR